MFRKVENLSRYRHYYLRCLCSCGKVDVLSYCWFILIANHKVWLLGQLGEDTGIRKEFDKLPKRF